MLINEAALSLKAQNKQAVNKLMGAYIKGISNYPSKEDWYLDAYISLDEEYYNFSFNFCLNVNLGKPYLKSYPPYTYIMCPITSGEITDDTYSGIDVLVLKPLVVRLRDFSFSSPKLVADYENSVGSALNPKSLSPKDILKSKPFKKLYEFFKDLESDKIDLVLKSQIRPDIKERTDVIPIAWMNSYNTNLDTPDGFCYDSVPSSKKCRRIWPLEDVIKDTTKVVNRSLEYLPLKQWVEVKPKNHLDHVLEVR